MITITLSNEQQNEEFQHDRGSIVLGRSSQGESPRLVIADGYVSRDQMRMEPLDGGRIRVTNLGGPVRIADQLPSGPLDEEETASLAAREIARGEAVELPLPLRMTAGYTIIHVSQVPEPVAFAASMQTLPRPIAAEALSGSGSAPLLSELGDAPAPQQLAEWFERLLKVQRAAAGSDEFYQETARAVVELIGLDRGLVLLRLDGRWDVVARHARRPAQGPDFSRKVLDQVVAEGRTFFQGLQDQDRMQSLAGVEAVVASPVFERNQVIGVVYGCRDLASDAHQSGVKLLEAQVTQLLAAAVSTGLARISREAEAVRARVQFEQFFSHDLALALEQNPHMLEGQQREITALFVDVRSFSRISESLGAANTYHLLHDVMDMLTDQVMFCGGVVIDYHGDGLAAMWNAPVQRRDHAQQACEAAMAMHASLPQVNDKWEPVLGFPLRIGAGLNTGLAQVGNAGSSRRMKYGPLGHSVNLASRIEGATKQFGVQVLVTEATRSQLSDSLPARRIGHVRVVGIHGETLVYELPTAADDRWLALKDSYERSLQHFEAGRLQEAQNAFRNVLSQFPDDKASQFLLDAIERQLQQPGPHEAIVELSSK